MVADGDEFLKDAVSVGSGRIDRDHPVQEVLALGPLQSTDPDLRDEVVPSEYELSFRANDFPVDALVQRVVSGRIQVPSFQRRFVWPRERAERFIESLLLGLPVPAIFLAEVRNSAHLLVIDGHQRLATLTAFYGGSLDGEPFRLDSISSRFQGLTYADLLPEDQGRLDDATIAGNILRQHSPDGEFTSVYFVFERLNSGSVPLTRQEIRRALNPGRFREVVDSISASEHWSHLVHMVRSPGGLPTLEQRSREEELAVRVLAFWQKRSDYARLADTGGTNARHEHSVVKFLDRFYYSASQAADEVGLAEWARRFEHVTERLDWAAGRVPFSPNTAMFEVICVLALEHEGLDDNYLERLVSLGDDRRFRRICSEFTSNAERVSSRYVYATEQTDA
ncbi:DUF262 domain-containing protein [Patulibacter sp. S7RM1-6]